MNDQNIGNLIQHFLTKNDKLSLFLEQQAIELWPQVVGEFVAKQTTKITAKNGVLIVSIPNAALRFEVMNSRNKIISKLNEMLGAEAIKGIVVR